MLGNINCGKMFNLKLYKTALTATAKYAQFSITHRALGKNGYTHAIKQTLIKLKMIEIISEVCSWGIKRLN